MTVEHQWRRKWKLIWRKSWFLLRGKSEVVQDLKIIAIPGKCVLDSWGSSICPFLVCSLYVWHWIGNCLVVKANGLGSKIFAVFQIYICLSCVCVCICIYIKINFITFLLFTRQNPSHFKEEIAFQRFEANIKKWLYLVFPYLLTGNCWSLPEYVGNGYLKENKNYSKKFKQWKVVSMWCFILRKVHTVRKNS